MSISKLKTGVTLVAIFGAVWIASIPTAELAFRLLGDEPSADLAGLYAQFEDGAYRLAPSIDTGAAWSAGAFSVHTDALGLRCDEDRSYATQPQEQLDVLFLGDSQGYGHGVDFENTIPGAFAVYANHHSVKARSAAVGGHAILNQLQLCRWLAEKHGVRASNYVLLLTPVMLSNGGGFVRATVGSDGRLYQQVPGLKARVLIWLKSKTAAYGRFRDALKNLGVSATPKTEPFVFQLYTAGSENENRLETNLLGTLTEFKQFAAAQGASLRLAYIPLTVEIEVDSLTSQAHARGLQLDLDLPKQICSSVAQRLDIPVYDLRPVVREFHTNNRPLHLKGDFHYNGDLSRACATNLWQQFKLQASLGTPTQFTRQ